LRSTALQRIPQPHSTDRFKPYSSDDSVRACLQPLWTCGRTLSRAMVRAAVTSCGEDCGRTDWPKADRLTDQLNLNLTQTSACGRLRWQSYRLRIANCMRAATVLWLHCGLHYCYYLGRARECDRLPLWCTLLLLLQSVTQPCQCADAVNANVSVSAAAAAAYGCSTQYPKRAAPLGQACGRGAK
jgi:hypothetical protein